MAVWSENYRSESARDDMASRSIAFWRQIRLETPYISVERWEVESLFLSHNGVSLSDEIAWSSFSTGSSTQILCRMPCACARTPSVFWLHVISDGLIALAYFVIPLALLRLVQKRQDLAFHWIFFLFAAFIFSCGGTHALAIVTFWTPVYRFEGVIRATTALVSLATAVFLV